MRGLIAAILLLAASASIRPPAAQTESPDLRTFFAFEREAWMETRGARLVLQPPARHPNNPVLARGQGDAIDAHRIDFTTLLPEGQRLRAWYGAIRAQKPGQGVDLWRDLSVGYAESDDGIHWVKPRLDLAEKGTNMVLAGAAYMTVAAEPEGGKGYRGIIAFFRPDVGQPGAGSGATFEVARSDDGLRWDFQKKPATAVRHFEPYGLFQRDGRWWVLGQGVPPYVERPEGLGHRVMYGFHSDNGKAFELYPRPLLAYPADRSFPDASPQHHVGAGVWDRRRVLLGMVGHFWPGAFGATASYSIGLIYSYDGIEWTEPFTQTPLLMPGPEGSWDRGWVLQVQRPVSKGDQTYLFYVGADGGNVWSAHADLGLALLRRDGFAALEPVEDTAELVTAPLDLQAGESMVYLNARGPVTVRVLDQYLRPVSADINVGEGVRVPALDLGKLSIPARFRLAFKLNRGSQLYTYSFGPQPSRLRPLAEWE